MDKSIKECRMGMGNYSLIIKTIFNANSFRGDVMGMGGLSKQMGAIMKEI